MMTKEKQVLTEWFEEVWHQGNEDALFRLFAEDGVAHGLEDDEGRPIVGPEGYLAFLRAYRSAFPDIRFEIVDTVQEEDRVSVRCVVRGTHTGEGLGIAPTHRRVEITGMTFGVVRDGQIQEAWNLFDFRSLMGQLAEGPLDDAPYDHA
ncbi:ester cyclase [Rubrivirga sp. IMCC43871]|uniref:ester cyclase n=1 Tax=Rubrivirga sp. IMCC43871 TaxID=3391575 RepID=UPI00398FBE67